MKKHAVGSPRPEPGWFKVIKAVVEHFEASQARVGQAFGKDGALRTALPYLGKIGPVPAIPRRVATE